MNFKLSTGASIHGIKGHGREIAGDLEKLRAKGNWQSLSQFLAQRDLEYGHVFNDLGIQITSDQYELLLSDEDTRWLVPEMWDEAIRAGLRSGPIWTDWVAKKNTGLKTTQVKMPTINMSKAVPQEAKEGETVKKGTISYSDRDINLKKYALGFEISYEAVRRHSIDFVNIFLEDFGVKLGIKAEKLAYTVLRNGDQADASMSPSVIGRTGDAVAYKDAARICLRMALLGRKVDSIIGSEAHILDLLELPEFKTPYAGEVLSKLNLKTGIPSQFATFATAHADAEDAIFLDSTKGLAYFEEGGWIIERDKIINRQMNEVVASITLGFANILRDARVVLDNSVLFSADGWESFMAVPTE